MGTVQQLISAQGDTDIAIGSLYFDNTKLQHVNHGIFWRPNVEYGHFLWEAVVKPEEGSGWEGYFVSDTQGGAHNLLWGMQQSASGFFGVTGNIQAGSPSPVTITDVNITYSYLTATNHGLFSGQIVTMASTGTLPSGLSAGNYYVIKLDADTFRLAASIANAMASTPVYVNLTSVGSGTITASWQSPAGLMTFSNGEQIPYGHWVHIAVAWDGTSIMTWINGVISSVEPCAIPYRLNPGGNNMTLEIGGSDHSNYRGNIAQIRGYETVASAIKTTDFAPELYFRPTQTFDNGATTVTPQFLVNYMTPATIHADYSGGFEDNLHHGVPEALQGVAVEAGSFIGTSLSLPTFIGGDITYGTYVPTPPAMPSDALIWDSFSRANADYLNPQDKTLGWFKLGNTEGGSLGIKTWTLPDGSADTSGHGVLHGKAFIVYQALDVVVDTETQDVDVRVDRGITTFYGNTGLLVRYKDANDYYQVIGEDSRISVLKHEGGVITGVTYTPSFGWKTLRVVVSGSTFTVYTGTATEGSFTQMGTFTCTNVIGATKAGLSRLLDIKTVYRYDNFLVKAA